MVAKYISFEGLETYHKKLMEYINSLVINRAFEYANCPNCGAKKPSADWTCSCGTVNTGNFCSNCGSKRP